MKLTLAVCPCGREFERERTTGRGRHVIVRCRPCIVAMLVAGLKRHGVDAWPRSVGGRLVAEIRTDSGPRHLEDATDLRWFLAELKVAAS